MFALLPILITGFLAFAIYRIRFFRLESVPAWAGTALFLGKLLFGFALWAVYTFYYTDRVNSDIYKFYDDAHYIHQAFGENKTAFYDLMTGGEDTSSLAYTAQMKNWERNFTRSAPFNENRFMIRLNALMMFASGENIHVHTILFCFLSFIGCILLLKVFQSYLPTSKKKWAPLTMLFPSFLFWTSGGLKESLILLGLGLLLYGFIFSSARKISSSIAFIAGIAILLLTKYFLLLCLLPALAAYYLFIGNNTLTATLAKYATALILSLVALVLIAPLDRRLDFIRIISVKQKHAIYEAQYVKAGSYSEVPVIEQNIFSIIKNLPTGLWNSLLKPYLWQSKNPMILLSAAENIALLLLLSLTLIYRDRRASIHYNLLFFMIAAALPYLCLIGVMTPVLGNLVRYKVVMLPMLIFIAMYVGDRKNNLQKV